MLANVPAEYYGDNPTLYKVALLKNMEGYSPDGLFTAQGAQNVFKVLNSFEPTVQAAKIDLRTGDVLVTIDGKKIEAIDDAKAAIQGAPKDKAYEVVVRRGREAVKATATGGGPLGVQLAQVDLTPEGPTAFAGVSAPAVPKAVQEVREASAYPLRLLEGNRVGLHVAEGAASFQARLPKGPLRVPPRRPKANRRQRERSTTRASPNQMRRGSIGSSTSITNGSIQVTCGNPAAIQPPVGRPSGPWGRFSAPISSRRKPSR